MTLSTAESRARLPPTPTPTPTPGSSGSPGSSAPAPASSSSSAAALAALAALAAFFSLLLASMRARRVISVRPYEVIITAVAASMSDTGASRTSRRSRGSESM